MMDFEKRELEQNEKLISSVPSEISKYWRALAKKRDSLVCIKRIPRNGFLIYLRGENTYIDLAWAPQYSREVTKFYDKENSVRILKLKAFW